MRHAAICPVCSCDVGEGDVVACPRCDTLHHVDCWSWVGERCAIFGCGEPTRLPMAVGVPAIEARVVSWHRLYTAQWVALGASVAGFTVTLLVVLAAVLFDALFLWGVPSTQYIRLVGFMAALGGLAACAVGVPSYLALMVPAELRRRRLEETLGAPFPTATVLPVRQVADRLDPPAVGRAVLAVVDLAEGFLLALALLGLVVGTGWLPPARGGSPTAFMWLVAAVPLVWMLVLMPIKALMRTRCAYLSSVQNRLVATLKKS